MSVHRLSTMGSSTESVFWLVDRYGRRSLRIMPAAAPMMITAKNRPSHALSPLRLREASGSRMIFAPRRRTTLSTARVSIWTSPGSLGLMTIRTANSTAKRASIMPRPVAMRAQRVFISCSDSLSVKISYSSSGRDGS